MVDGIIALGVTRSVREVPVFFRRVGYEIGGRFFSPDHIEHGVLRANRRPPGRMGRIFGPLDARRILSLRKVEPRVHFALVCGSRSCAPIRFYDPERVREDLELAAVGFVNGREVEIDREGRRLRISAIFRWYERDFGGVEGVPRSSPATSWITRPAGPWRLRAGSLRSRCGPATGP